MKDHSSPLKKQGHARDKKVVLGVQPQMVPFRVLSRKKKYDKGEDNELFYNAYLFWVKKLNTMMQRTANENAGGFRRIFLRDSFCLSAVLLIATTT